MKIAKTVRRVHIAVMVSKDNQFYFVLKAGNGEVVATSETYHRRRDACRAAQRFRDLVAQAEVL